MRRQADTQIEIEVGMIFLLINRRLDRRAFKAVILKEVRYLRRFRILECWKFVVGSRPRNVAIVAAIVGLAERTMRLGIESLA